MQGDYSADTDIFMTKTWDCPQTLELGAEKSINAASFGLIMLGIRMVRYWNRELRV